MPFCVSLRPPFLHWYAHIRFGENSFATNSFSDDKSMAKCRSARFADFPGRLFLERCGGKRCVPIHSRFCQCWNCHSSITSANICIVSEIIARCMRTMFLTAICLWSFPVGDAQAENHGCIFQYQRRYQRQRRYAMDEGLRF